MMIMQSFAGLIAFIGFAWAVSEARRSVPWRTVAAGFGLQLVLGATLLRLPASQEIFLALNHLLQWVTTANEAGASFVFGFLGGGPLPFEGATQNTVYVFAFRVLPLLILISALASLLFYWRVLPMVVKAMAAVLQKTMRVSGAVGLGAAANIFIGMVEAPLLVRPYLASMSRGELFAVMTCGMATIAGTVMVLYATILSVIIPDAIGHILTASLINAPAAIVVAALMVPPGDGSAKADLVPPRETRSSMDAITNGTVQGVQLAINIAAMLFVLVALVSLINQALGLLPGIGSEPLTMQRILGFLMAPVVWLMGIPWGDAQVAGALMGTKTVLNELIAYTELADLPAGALSLKSRLVMTYAMCGFANFGSVGIMIGGMGTMVPERRAEIAALGLKAIVSGTLATCMTGAVVNIMAP